MSTFTILSWCFYWIAVVSALILTALSSPLIRRYRKTLISLVITGIILGTLSWVTPLAMRRWNPDQSRLTPFDQLTSTQWLEPVSNPETEVPAEVPEDEISWLKDTPYRFRYKIGFQFEVKKLLATHGSMLIFLDQNGTLRGFNAYTGLNHWQIELHATHFLQSLEIQNRFYILDKSKTDTLRVTCLDLKNPAVLWQRTIPNSREGALSFTLETQTVLVTTGVNGIWALKGQTGEIFWKRPEIYTRTLALPSQKHILVFEPAVGNHVGSWHFLDPQSGKTLSKNQHVYPAIDSFSVEHETHQSGSRPVNYFSTNYFLASIDASHLFYMNYIDLSQLWSFHTTEPVARSMIMDENTYLLLYDSQLLEQRSLRNNELIWQKKLTDSRSDFLKLSPDRQWITIPSQDPEHATTGIAFFRSQGGDYVFTAKTSESLIDLQFFGEWFYLVSENHLWAFQGTKKN